MSLIENLPPEILIQIFEYAGYLMFRLRLPLCCRYFNALYHAHWKYLIFRTGKEPCFVYSYSGKALLYIWDKLKICCAISPPDQFNRHLFVFRCGFYTVSGWGKIYACTTEEYLLILLLKLMKKANGGYLPFLNDFDKNENLRKNIKARIEKKFGLEGVAEYEAHYPINYQ